MESKVTTSAIVNGTIESNLCRWTIPWYELTEQLASNSICHVFKACRKGFEQSFVVKILKAEYADDARTIKRFENAAKQAATINQPNLVPTYDHGITTDGLPYYVTDFIDGVPLSTIIRDHGVLPDDEAIDIFIQICDALEGAHSEAVLHHNLKPGNVFITKTTAGNHLVKVTDIGVTKFLPAINYTNFLNTNDEHTKIRQSATTVEKAGLVEDAGSVDNPASVENAAYAEDAGLAEIVELPTNAQNLMANGISDARYMSPEQCRGEKLDARSDVYSLGCLMYHTLGGKPPHKGSNPIFTALKRIEKNPVPLSQRFPELDVSLALENVVMRALHEDKELRYQTIADLRQDLVLIKEAAQAALLRRKRSDPLPVHGRISDHIYSRLVLLTVFVISIFITYSNHTLNENIINKAKTSALHSTPQANPPESESDTPVIGKSDQAGSSLFDIYSTNGRLLFSAYGASFGEVLEHSAKNGIDMSNANLKGQVLMGLSLPNAKLSNADFNNANLTGTDFSHANLQDAQFSSSTVNGAIFDYARLQGSIFTDSDFSDSRFYSADVRNSHWRDCTLDRANLSAANFSGAQVFQVDLPGASLAGTNGLVVQNRFPEVKDNFVLTSIDGRMLYKSQNKQTFKETVEEAIRNGISLKDVNFRAVDLSQANLAKADLRNADLRGTLLSGARLENADLTGASASGAFLESSADELQRSGVKGWQVLMP
jgi:serine/threonine protein kinase